MAYGVVVCRHTPTLFFVGALVSLEEMSVLDISSGHSKSKASTLSQYLSPSQGLRPTLHNGNYTTVVSNKLFCTIPAHFQTTQPSTSTAVNSTRVDEEAITDEGTADFVTHVSPGIPQGTMFSNPNAAYVARELPDSKEPDGGYGWVCVVCMLFITANTWGSMV
jgi:hypothetical protein